MEGAFGTTFSAPSETAALPQLQVWQRPVPLVLAGLTLMLLGGLIAWSTIRPTPGLVARFDYDLPDGQSFINTGRALTAISPDGRAFVYNTADGLYLRAIGELEARLIPGTTDDLSTPFFSPDGQSLGYWDRASSELKRVRISGGAPVTIAATAGNPYGVAWKADDRILYGQRDRIWQVPATGGTPELLIPTEDGELFHGPRMLPGGEWVLFTLRSAGTSAWDEAQIVVQSVTAGGRKVVIDGGRDARYVPTGHLVYGLNGVILGVPFDLGSREVTGGPVSLIDGVATATGSRSGMMLVALADNGSLVYVPGSGGTVDDVSLVWVDRDGDETVISAPPRAYGAPRVSPDGTRIAVDISDGESSDVWVWDLAREALIQLTFDAGSDQGPLWTPDSARVVFRSTRDNYGLYSKAADGTGQVEILHEFPAGVRASSWSTDGRLVFEQQPGDIGVLALAGEPNVEMLFDAEYAKNNPTISPDGRWLAYTSRETGRPLIYVQPFPNIDDGKWLVSTNSIGLQPVWSPDGRELFYRDPGGMMAAQIETDPTFSARTPERLLTDSGWDTSGGGRQYDIAPDGDRFVFRKSAGDVGTSEAESFNGLIFIETGSRSSKRACPSTEHPREPGTTLDPYQVAAAPDRGSNPMRYVAISAILAAVLFPTSFMAQTPDPQGEKTYGLGLPRDRDVLFIPDSDYPDWPLRPDQMDYADVSGSRMKEWVLKISAISLQSRAAGNMYWGRLPGTVYDARTMDLMIDEFERLGLETERVPHTIPRDWSPTFWKASYTARGRSVALSTAFPVGQTAATPPEGITAEAVWVGVGSAPDFLGRDVEGKAVIIYSTFVPGGRSHSASDRAGMFGANTRASELGAALIMNVMAVPGNAQFNPLGAPSADYGVPLITISQDDGFALRDVLGAGETVQINLKLDIEIRENIETANVFARLPGASDEEVVIAVHTDGFFQASLDNASGMASALEIARHHAAMPRDERPRTLLFVLFPDHHHGETGLRAWEQTYDWHNVAMALTLEHPSQTQLYWYNDDLMTSNTIGAFRWNAMGSPGFLDLVNGTLRDFGVSVYTVMDGRPKLTSQAPGFHIIDHVIYHTTLDTPELVPAEGMERATRAFLSVIDQVNEMTLAELRAPTMF